MPKRENKPTEYTIDGIEYHRNGISGDGFYNLSVTMREDGWYVPSDTDPSGQVVGVKEFDLYVVIPSDVFSEERAEAKKDGSGSVLYGENGLAQVYIIDRDNFRQNWRGDRIGADLLPHLTREVLDAAFPTLNEAAAKLLPLTFEAR